MRNNKTTIASAGLIFIVMLSSLLLLVNPGLADDHHKFKGWFEKEERDHLSIFNRKDEGNETAGQIAAWLFFAANLPVILSVLIKWTNRFALSSTKLKNALTGFNRFQKKHLMRFHYVINPMVLGIALWHWLSSRCRSTALPEWGLVVMVGLMVLGLIMKFGLCPKQLRRSVYQLHTQPLVLVVMVTVLTIGHLIVD